MGPPRKQRSGGNRTRQCGSSPKLCRDRLSHASSAQEFQSFSDQILATDGYLGIIQDSSFVPDTSQLTKFLWVVKDVIEDNSQLYSCSRDELTSVDGAEEKLASKNEKPWENLAGMVNSHCWEICSALPNSL